MAQNLPVAQQRAADIRGLLEKSRKQMEAALPKHLTADRLLRVAMTSIQRTPKLLECTPKSLLACVMTCAQLGLEPDQFLGQAYLVPFRNHGTMECTLIPGYRGYIALARRSGEVQTVASQVVYEKDQFDLVFGIEDRLEHRPHINGDRGAAVGAYCVFKYKDGGYSFDFMSVDDIERIRKRSKASGLQDDDKKDVPWVTDWDEMAKKTVIKRHAKLAPMSVEFQRAAALEDRAFSGDSQSDLLEMPEGSDADVIDAEAEVSPEDAIKSFDESIPKETDMELLASFMAKTAKANGVTIEAFKVEAAKDLPGLWKFFSAWVKQEEAKKTAANKADPMVDRFDCPDGGFVTLSVCENCKKREDSAGVICPAYSSVKK